MGDLWWGVDGGVTAGFEIRYELCSQIELWIWFHDSKQLFLNVSSSAVGPGHLVRLAEAVMMQRHPPQAPRGLRAVAPSGDPLGEPVQK